MSAADAAAVNPSGIKALLVNGLSTFFINGKSTFANVPRSLPRNHPDYTILEIRVFGSFILADELFAKVLGSVEACLAVSNDLWEKSVSSLDLPIVFHDCCRVASVSFLIADFIKLWIR